MAGGGALSVWEMAEVMGLLSRTSVLGSQVKKTVRWMADRKQLRERQKTEGPGPTEVCLVGSCFPSAAWEGCGAPECELSCSGNAEWQSLSSPAWVPACT